MSRHDQPGLEVVPDDSGLHPVQPEALALMDNTDKEHADLGKGRYADHYRPDESTIPTVTTAKHKRLRKYRIIGAAVAAVAIIVIAIAVPVALTRQQGDSENQGSSSPAGSSSTAVAVPTVTANPYTSSSGAFNGTGMALLPGGGSSTRQIIFQHASGQLRQSSWSWGGSWTGGSNSASDIVVSSGARNGTPIAGVTYPANGVNMSRIIYVDQNDTLQDVVQNGGGQPWKPGILGQNKYTVFKALGASLAMNAINNFSNPEDNESLTSDGGIKIYWPGSDGQLREGVLPYDSNSWKVTYTFDRNLSASSGYQTWVYNQVSYLWAINSTNSYLTLYYENPGIGWLPGSPSRIGTANGSSLSFTDGDLLTYQDPHNNVLAINTTSDTRNGVWNAARQVGSNNPTSVSGSRIGSAISMNNGVKYAEIYFQSNGSSITQWLIAADSLLSQDTSQQNWLSNMVSVGE